MERQNPIEFRLGEEVEYNLNDKNFFKFEYLYESDSPQDIYFYFGFKKDLYIYLSDNLKSSIYKLNGQEELIKVNLIKSGIYYIEFYSPTREYFQYNRKFTTFVPDKLIDSIDLRQNVYFGNSIFKTKIKLWSNKYKVKNLQKDTLVFFNYNIANEDYKLFNNPFEICNDNTTECISNISFFKFKQGYEYSIHIKLITLIEIDSFFDEIYYYPSYVFFPILENILEEKKEGFYSISEPKIFIINLDKKDYLFLHFENANQVYLSYSNQENIINNLNDLNMNEISDLCSISGKNGYNFGIIMIIPLMNNKTTKMIIANQLINNDEQEEYIIKTGQNAIIIINNTINNEWEEEEWNDEEWDEEEENVKISRIPLSYNTLTTFYSEGKYMRLIKDDNISDIYDFIIQNSFSIPIYIEKYNKDIKIKIKTYKPRYSFFIALNDNLIKNYISQLSENPINDFLLDANQPFPLNIRVNFDYFMIFDFINFYLYKAETNIIIYIKNFYGQSEFFECNADSIDKNDLSIITKPLNNCKNKESILNKVYNLDGTKLITGYLGYNSFFDIYLDINDNNTNIKLSTLGNGFLNNSAKYLKKEIEYTLDFSANHLVKLDPGFNAEISIYDNDGKNFKIDSENPTAEIQGNNLKIKSNNNAMVYFYSKLTFGFNQIKIEPEKGKNIEINIKRKIMFAIDFGFEGYILNDIFSLSASSIENGKYYLENIYEKLKTKLVKGEYLYLYYTGLYGDDNFEISYDNYNLNNPNNEYIFNVIPKNAENKTLIINNYFMNSIIFQINFCKSPHDIKMFYQTSNSVEELSFVFNSQKRKNVQKLNKLPLKLRFESKEDFVFSYSFFDNGDILSSKNEEWSKYRKELEKLIIKEVIVDNFGFISINFYPNYQSSSTRYIIVITPKNENNTLETLSNPCHISNLATEKAEGVKIINIVDIGEKELINVNVDINDNDFLANNEFIIGIISQELRFDKKINFYEPIEFTYNKPIEIEIEKKQEFILDDKAYFDLLYEKKTKENEMLLLNYQLEKEIPMIINIKSHNNDKKSFNIYDKEGYINFLCDESGHYIIEFEKNEINNLRSIGNNNKIEFKILSNENPFIIDITKDNN